MIKYFTLSTVVIFSLLIVGCGPKIPSDIPKLYPATITITADGEKLSNASVTLFPIAVASGQSNVAVGATTDDKGVAKLRTQGLYDGSPSGKYKVCVNWAITIDGPTSKTPPPTDPKQLEAYNKKVAYEQTSKPALDPQFMSSKTTPLEVEITEGKNDFSLEVNKLTMAR